MEIREAYKQKRAAQLQEWSAQINLLEAKVENLSADFKLKRTEAIQSLRAKHQVAANTMKELSMASGDAWDEIKSTADKIWDDLKVGVADVSDKFK